VEQRRFSRIAFTADVRITAGGTTIEARTTDLSLGGMRLSTPERIPEQETVDVLIAVPETCPPCSISARAVVVRHDDQGMGLAFSGMELESFFTLARLISEGLGDQARGARELLDFLRSPPEIGRHPADA
jgi:c-di-GMP-binding flagellar brake protein YcgR